MTECEEVAANMNLDHIRSHADAEREVTRQMGPASEVGYVIHANIAWALWERAQASRNTTED